MVLDALCPSTWEGQRLCASALAEVQMSREGINMKTKILLRNLVLNLQDKQMVVVIAVQTIVHNCWLLQSHRKRGFVRAFLYYSVFAGIVDTVL